MADDDAEQQIRELCKVQHSRRRGRISLAGPVLILSVTAVAGIVALLDYNRSMDEQYHISDTYVPQPSRRISTPIDNNVTNNVPTTPQPILTQGHPIPTPQDEASIRLLEYARTYFTQLSELSHESQGPFTQQILDDIASQYHKKIGTKQMPEQVSSLLESKLSLVNEQFDVLDINFLSQEPVTRFIEFYRDYSMKNLGTQPTPEEKAAIDKIYDALAEEIIQNRSSYHALRARIRTGSGIEKDVDTLWIDDKEYRIIVAESGNGL